MGYVQGGTADVQSRDHAEDSDRLSHRAPG
jgi:hypothetical protein